MLLERMTGFSGFAFRLWPSSEVGMSAVTRSSPLVSKVYNVVNGLYGIRETPSLANTPLNLFWVTTRVNNHLVLYATPTRCRAFADVVRFLRSRAYLA